MNSPDAAVKARRRLPTVPSTARVPRRSCVTSFNAALPASAIPPESRSFRGFSGKASLFTETYNVTLLPAKVQLMQTGAHLLAEITCTTCTAYLGYKIVRAMEASEKWKESRFMLELAELENPHRPGANGLDSSDSEDSS
ncbi:Yippee domain-containing protein [Mycena sanguinolenta]|uniref:Yippee domain-containing protein n=1 Tax=Mycena sanguinolenta TaxID=230812 RepID=A0A8H7DKY8_9AGAR|nr:Yippee domain-containing protein [Mycena sanguinolenta]